MCRTSSSSSTKDGPACDADGAEFCHRLGSAFFDFELGFGDRARSEVGALVRVGVVSDAAARSLPLLFGLGLRSYTSDSAAAKLFLAGRIVLDATQSDIPSWGSVDFGVRGEFGLAVDVMRYVGLYAQLGETIGFLRALSFNPDVTSAPSRFP